MRMTQVMMFKNRTNVISRGYYLFSYMVCMEAEQLIERIQCLFEMQSSPLKFSILFSLTTDHSQKNLKFAAILYGKIPQKRLFLFH